MGSNFTFRRIAQDAFDPVALSDEVDESAVSSVKHGVTRSHLLSVVPSLLSCFGKLARRLIVIID
jgi:hypothetical protein